MNKNLPTTQLHKEANSSDEGSPSSREQKNIRKKSLGCAFTDPSPKETVADAEIQNNDFEKSPIKKLKKSDVEVSTEISPTKDIKKHHPCDKNTLSRKSPVKKVINPSQENNLSTNAGSTLETQDNSTSRHVVGETEEIKPEDEAAEALELKYMNKYASENSKELVFAIDLMTLVRHLNKLEFRYIVYATTGTAPTSPCDDVLDKALAKMWETVNDNSSQELECQMKNKNINYLNFQELMIKMAVMEEEEEFDEESFLTYCLLLAQSAVCAEGFGVQNAREFVPLVICRTIQNLKDAGKLPSNFWKRIAAKAAHINGAEKQ